jgi:hypothetical protein
MRELPQACGERWGKCIALLASAFNVNMSLFPKNGSPIHIAARSRIEKDKYLPWSGIDMAISGESTLGNPTKLGHIRTLVESTTSFNCLVTTTQTTDIFLLALDPSPALDLIQTLESLGISRLPVRTRTNRVSNERRRRARERPRPSTLEASQPTVIRPAATLA